MQLVDIQAVKLSELTNGTSAIITKVKGHGAFRKRITEMGFVAGTKVTVIKKAPLQDPVEYELMGYRVSLRLSEAQMRIPMDFYEDIFQKELISKLSLKKSWMKS